MKDAPSSLLADTGVSTAPVAKPPALSQKAVVQPETIAPAIVPKRPTADGTNLRTITIWVAAAGIAVALALYWGWSSLFGALVTAVKAQRGEIVQTIVVSGTVETNLKVNLGAQILGTVLKVHVKEGDSVRAGDPLIVLRSEDAEGQVGQALAAVRQAQAKLALFGTLTRPTAAQLVAQTGATQRNLAQQLDRTSKLYRRGFATRAQLDIAQSNFDVAAAQSRSALLSLANASPDGRDVAFASSALEAAKASLRAAQSKLALTTIKAPTGGIVISRTVEAGQIAQPGATLLILAPNGERRLVVQIDERNLSLIRLGQTAVASADAYPRERFNAVLTTIGPAIDVQRGSVEAKFEIPDAPAYLIEDMTVSVDVEVARKANALTLPFGVVRNAASNPSVLVIFDGRAVERRITLGARGEANVEVLSGLTENDIVVQPGVTPIAAGQTVRVQSPAHAP